MFVRFSNFIGSRGSKDTAIDVRGFATKFYAREGQYLIRTPTLDRLKAEASRRGPAIGTIRRLRPSELLR